MSKSMKRKCPECGAEMIESATASSTSASFLSDKKQNYRCGNCDETVCLTLPGSILLNFLTGLFGLLVLFLFIGNFKSLLSWFSQGGFGWLVGCGIFLVAAVLIIGGGVALSNGVRSWRENAKYPVTNRGKMLPPILGTWLFSALPVLLMLAFGFYDFYVQDLSEDWAIVILPIIFSPLFIGAKLGMSFVGLFLGCGFWTAILVSCILIFG